MKNTLKKFRFLKKPKWITSILVVICAFAISAVAFTGPPAGCTPDGCPNGPLAQLFPENVKDGVTIAGVTGNYTDNLQVCTDDNNGNCKIPNGTSKSDINTDLIAANILSGVTIFGITGSFVETPVTAVGGTITEADGYIIHTFTTSGTFTPNGEVDVEYLVVAGGGGGGSSGANYCGGGGAGGLLTGTGFGVTAQTYAITVGNGGAAKNNGSNSVFSNIVSIGGGAGASPYASKGIAGGSGGGGTPVYGDGGAAVAGQGYAGGGASSANQGGTDSGAGGGGGAGGRGASGDNHPFSNSPGPGGVGVESSISGTAKWYASGGTGAGWYSHSGTNGIGGSVYGGHANGTVNTGAGGGGGRSGGGGAGGSGIIIIRYLANN